MAEVSGFRGRVVAGSVAALAAAVYTFLTGLHLDPIRFEPATLPGVGISAVIGLVVGTASCRWWSRPAARNILVAVGAIGLLFAVSIKLEWWGDLPAYAWHGVMYVTMNVLTLLFVAAAAANVAVPRETRS